MPKFPGVLLNNNPNAPSLDLNDLQVKGVGIFADVAERDALDVNIQTEGYLSVMKNDDNVYIYKGGGWTTPANWEKISGTIGFTDSDGNPLGEVSTLVFPEGSISIVGSSGVVAFTAGGTSTDTTNFNGVLSSADTTVQAALDTLDGLSLTLEGLGDTPSGYGTAGQVLISNGVDGFTFGSGSPWDEVAGTTTDILYEEGRVGIRDLTSWNAQSGNISSGNNLGAGFPGANTQAHIHGKLGISVTRTDNNTYDEALRIVNDRHSGSIGIGIGTYDYGSQIRLYGAFSFTNSIGSLRLNVGGLNGMTTELGGVTIGLGGIDLPGNHYSGAQNYKLRMAGVIQFKNHSSVEWDAIHQGPGTYANAGVVIGTPRSGDVLYVRNSDVNTVGSFGYVGVNANNPSATGPAFEVSSSYAKFNNGLHIGDITATGYAFPTATGTTGQVLKVDANGDLVFGDDEAGLWTEDTNGITYTAGNVGIGTASDSGYDLNVGSGIILEAGQLLFNSVSDGIRLQSVFNTTAGVGIGYQALASGGPGAVAIGNRVGSPNSGTVVIGYSSQQMGYTATDPRAVHIGLNAGMTATTALDTVAIGNSPLSSLTTGSGNIAIGRTAGSAITTQSNNTFIGYEAGRLNTGSGNTFIGGEAGESSLSTDAVSIGSRSNAGGSGSVAIGNYASATGTNSVAVGRANASGSYSVAIGRSAGATGTSSIAIGWEAKAGANSIVISDRANKYTSTSSSNVILGFGDRATFGDGNVSVGNSFIINRNDSATLRPRSNVSLGHGNFNYSPLNSYSNLVVGGGNFNNSGASAEIAYNAVMSSGLVGTGSPMRNTVIGQRNGTGQAVLGDDNVFLGYNAGFNEIGSNKLYIANSDTTTPLIYGEFDNEVLRVNGTIQSRYQDGAGTNAKLIAIGENITGTLNTFASNSISIGYDLDASKYRGGCIVIGNNIDPAASNPTIGGDNSEFIAVGRNITFQNYSQSTVMGSNITATPTLAGANRRYNFGRNIKDCAVAFGSSIHDQGTTSTGPIAFGTSIFRYSAAGSTIGIGSNIFSGSQLTSCSNVFVIGTTINPASTRTSVNNSVLIGLGVGSNMTSGGEVFFIGTGNTGKNATSAAWSIGHENQKGIVSGGFLSIGNRLNTGNNSINLLASTRDSNSVAIGRGVTSVATDNQAGGNVIIGRGTDMLSGTYNSYLGYNAGGKAAGNENVAVGRNALFANASAATLGQNIAIGKEAGYDHNGGSRNMYFGYRQGYQKTESDRLRIDVVITETPLIYGEFDNDIVKINGDFEVTGSNGVTLTSPNGTRYKVTVTDAGALSVTAA